VDDLSSITAARIIDGDKIRVTDFMSWRTLLVRRQGSGLSCILRSYAYGPALDALLPLTEAEAVSVRVIARLRGLKESSYGNCSRCASGTLHAVLMRDIALEHNSVLMGCDYCPWRGPISFVAPHIIAAWVESQKADGLESNGLESNGSESNGLESNEPKDEGRR